MTETKTSSACRAFVSAALAASAVTAAWAQASADQPATAAQTAREDLRKAMADLEARYVVGPATADDFGFRIAWQTDALATKDAHLQALGVTADSAWFGDSAGSVVRLRRDSGETVWRASTYQGIERMLAIEYLPAERRDNVYVLTELGCVALDAATGNLARRTRFSQLPSAAPAVFGPSMIFGTRTGLASWFQYANGYNWRATTLGGQVNAPVTVSGELALAGSTSGTVLAMDAGNAGIRWRRSLSAGVEAPIAADGEACYVAGLDQSLWAFDLMRGRVLWQYFTQSALTNPPVRIADGLYLQIPGEGLVAFTPLPAEKPDGEVRWKSKAPGNVIGRVGSNLMAWDAATRTLSAVDAGTGRIVHQAKLPRAEAIRFVPAVDGNMFVASAEGNVERLETLAAASGAARPMGAARANEAGTSAANAKP